MRRAFMVVGVTASLLGCSSEGSEGNGAGRCTMGDTRQAGNVCFPPNCPEGWACPQGVATGCVSSACTCGTDGIWACLPDCAHTVACVPLTEVPDASNDAHDP
jgi:hypothetical protein